MNPFDKAWDLLKFQNLQSELEMGYDDPRYEKAIGLTYAPTANSPAKPSINLAQRNPARTAPKDAFFNTDDVNELARRLSLIDAHEAMGHGEDPMLGHLLNLREHIRHNMPDEQPDKNRMLSQLSAAIEAPGITMEELVNESINPRVSDKSLSERVRDNFAERAGEPGAMFGGGQDTMSAEDARADMGIAESVRSQIGAGYGMPPYSTFGKAWDLLKRQTTLGEHKGFEDAAFSPHGEVRYYHGTTKTPADHIMEQGLHPYLSLIGEGVFTAKDPGLAADYARERGKERNEEPRVFGIRTGVRDQQLPQQEGQVRMNEELGLRGGTKVRTFDEAIPREYLVPMDVSDDSYYNQQQKLMEWARQQQ